MKNEYLLRWYQWRFAFKTNIKRKSKSIIKRSPRLIGTIFVIGTLLLPSFIPFISVQNSYASNYYDSGWIYVNSPKFHAEEVFWKCYPSKLPHPLALIWGGSNDKDAWVDLNVPAGQYKVDMKIAYSHRPNTPPQTDETMRVYTGKNFNLNSIPPAGYTDKANVPDMGDDVIRKDKECEDIKKAIQTYTNVAGRALTFPEEGDLAIEGTGSSIILYAIRVYGTKSSPHLSISKLSRNVTENTSWAETTSAKPGQKVAFKIQVKSNGKSTAFKVKISDILPKKLTYIPGSTLINNTPGPDGIVNSGIIVASLAPGQNLTITFKARVAGPEHFSFGCTTLTNTAYVGANNLSPISDTATIQVCKEKPKLPVLNISKYVNKTKASPSDTIIYTLKVKNTGKSKAENVIVKDPFVNPGQTYLQFINSNPWSSNFIWKIGTLNPGQEKQITITAKIADKKTLPFGTTTIKNRASVESNQTTKIYSNYVQTIVENNPPVVHPNLSISKLARNLSQGESSWSKTVYAEPGDEIEFYIRIESTGDTTAKNVYVKDILPYKMSYISGSTYGATTYDITSGWRNIGNIPPGDSKAIYFRAKIYEESYFSTGSTVLINNAKTYADNVWTVSDSAEVIVNKETEKNSPNITINKLVRNISNGDNTWSNTVYAEPDDEVEFYIRIESTGDAVAKNVRVKDYLPYKTSYVSGSTYGATTNDITSSWVNIGDLNPGESRNIYFRARVYDKYSFSSGTTTLTNQAKAYADEVNYVSDTAKIVVEKEEEPEENPNLSISKLARNLSRGESSWSKTVYAEPGDEIEFYIRIESTGDTTAKNVYVKDILPYKMSYISGSTYGATNDSIINTWEKIGDINIGESKVIYFKAKVFDENYFSNGTTELTNEVKATGNSIGTVSDTCKISVFKKEKTPIIVTTKELSFSKLVRNLSTGETGLRKTTSANPENIVEFSLQIANIGTEKITNIKIWDVLPDGLTYIDGTSFLDGKEIGDGIAGAAGAGVLINQLLPGQTKTLTFQAQLTSSENFSVGTTTLLNTAYVNADDISTISDTASIIISKGKVLGAATVQTGPAETFAISLIISFLLSLAIYLLIKNEEEVKAILKKLGIKDSSLAKFYSYLKFRFVLARIRIKEGYIS